MERAASWAVVAGCYLAFLSAAVDVGVLLLVETSVGHLTGDTVRVAAEVIHGADKTEAAASKLFAALTGFVLGALASGFMIPAQTFNTTRPYGEAVLAIAGMLGIAHFLLPRTPELGIFTVAFCCGLQNALASRYRQLILRTTHITGLLTDFGSTLGMHLRGTPIETWRIIVPGGLCLSFIAGAFFGAVLTLADWPFLLILAGMYGGGVVAWGLTSHFRHREGC